MKAHTKIYFDYYGIAYYPGGEHEPVTCEVCKKRAVDIHHVDYNRKNNDIDNLIALCRGCHEDAHNEVLTKGDLRVAHLSNLY